MYSSTFPFLIKHVPNFTSDRIAASWLLSHRFSCCSPFGFTLLHHLQFGIRAQRGEATSGLIISTACVRLWLCMWDLKRKHASPLGIGKSVGILTKHEEEGREVFVIPSWVSNIILLKRSQSGEEARFREI